MIHNASMKVETNVNVNLFFACTICQMSNSVWLLLIVAFFESTNANIY